MVLYIDVRVAAPNGEEFTLEVFSAASGGPGRTPRTLRGLLDLYRFRRQWRVRVQPWPPDHWDRSKWTCLVETWEDAIALCTELTRLIEAGQWAPAQGSSPFAASNKS